MKERTRQRMLKDGSAVSRAQLAKLIKSAHYSSWSGCMTGADWCGRRIWVNGNEVGGGEHQQNDAPTGYERRGRSSHGPVAVAFTIGARVTIKDRNPCGRNLDGDTCYKTETIKLIVV